MNASSLVDVETQECNDKHFISSTAQQDIDDLILLYPGQYGFDEILDSLRPPGWRQEAKRNYGDFTIVKDLSSGVMRVEGFQGTTEYLLGGEYNAIVEMDDELFDEENST
ncbi:MAG: hypothetical protein F6K41_05270 [Symploca sp. SIO3E6]|nr:hypothetical protein [Caldora sp. SIO3E6]